MARMRLGIKKTRDGYLLKITDKPDDTLTGQGRREHVMNKRAASLKSVVSKPGPSIDEPVRDIEIRKIRLGGAIDLVRTTVTGLFLANAAAAAAMFAYLAYLERGHDSIALFLAAAAACFSGGTVFTLLCGAAASFAQSLKGAVDSRDWNRKNMGRSNGWRMMSIIFGILAVLPLAAGFIFVILHFWRLV